MDGPAPVALCQEKESPDLEAEGISRQIHIDPTPHLEAVFGQAFACDNSIPLTRMIAEKGSQMNEEQDLEREIKELEERLRDRELALPAHSIRPSQLLIIEELEEEIKEKKRRLAVLKG